MAGGGTMKVGFYGNVRQYHNIKSEIDANIQQVLESGSFVMGPMGDASVEGLPGAGGWPCCRGWARRGGRARSGTSLPWG